MNNLGFVDFKSINLKVGEQRLNHKGNKCGKETKGTLCHIVDREAPILQFAEVRKGQGGSGVLDIVDFHGNYSLSASSS